MHFGAAPMQLGEVVRTCGGGLGDRVGYRKRSQFPMYTSVLFQLRHSILRI